MYTFCFPKASGVQERSRAMAQSRLLNNHKVSYAWRINTLTLLSIKLHRELLYFTHKAVHTLCQCNKNCFALSLLSSVRGDIDHSSGHIKDHDMQQNLSSKKTDSNRLFSLRLRNCRLWLVNFLTAHILLPKFFYTPRSWYARGLDDK